MSKQIPLTQGKFALVDDEDFEFLSQWKWLYHKGYAVRNRFIGIFKKYKKVEHICMHRVIVNTPVGKETDHVNGDKLDNRKENLRICTREQNSRNRKLDIDSTSGFKGVFWMGERQKWRSGIRVNSKFLYLGYFKTALEAAKAYNIAARRYFGRFARLNILQEA